MRWTINRYNRQRYLIYIGCMLLSTFASAGFADELDLVTEVEFQPLASATQRLIEALDYLGSPLSEGDLATIQKTLVSEDHKQAIDDIQKSLDPYCRKENLKNETYARRG